MIRWDGRGPGYHAERRREPRSDAAQAVRDLPAAIVFFAGFLAFLWLLLAVAS